MRKTREPVIVPRLTDSQLDSFWSNVSIAKRMSDCWEWLGYRTRFGHGTITGPYYAHRVAFWLFNPDWDQSGVICHLCNNPSCVNPNHLMKGTQVDNNRHMVMAMRGNTQKLSLEDGAEIRQKSRKGASQKALSLEYGVSQAHISRILHNRCLREQ